MWLNVRTFCGTRTERLDGLSKLTKIETLRAHIAKTFNVAPDQQRLFYRGKLLVDKHTLYDYNVCINDTIQLMISKIRSEDKDQVVVAATEPQFEDSAGLYNIGEEVDVYDAVTFGWFEGIVRKCYKKITERTAELYYLVKLDGYEEVDNMNVKSDEIRPRAHHIYPLSDLECGMKVMVNYNLDNPAERGFWYDAYIQLVTKCDVSKCDVTVRLQLGESQECSADVTLTFVEDIFRVESRLEKQQTATVITTIAKRQSAPLCTHCHDNPRRKCKYCACSVCGSKDNPDKLLLCDECDQAFHLYCLSPKLSKVPEEDDWYCKDCKNDVSEIVQAGEGVKTKKKTSRQAVSKSDRDWGKGMACQGRTSICTIVPQNHVGPVPGIPVGSMWKYRLQVSEVGVHRPHVAGIHGRAEDGAYSIVLSGGYEDDKDLGDEFYYTGSGGRDLSGNKRTAEQSCDQKLTKMNLALARCCAAPLDVEHGAEAGEWQEGRQIRVVRNCKLAKHSKFAPKEGNRYDGIYKLVKYWPEKGRSGFLVWRYFLRRDDPSPAPWTREGQAQTKKLGLKIVYPEGYDKENSAPKSKKKRKRTNQTLEDPHLTSSKKCNNEIDPELKSKIKLDSQNSKHWKELCSDFSNWHDKVTTQFTCVICTDLVCEPVTAPCSHNMCYKCLQRSFQAEVYTCPNCRFDLKEDFDLKVNKNLQNVLLDIFPGYDAGR